MSRYVLLADLGNTTSKFGLADGAGIAGSFVLPTDRLATPDSLGLCLVAAAAHLKAAPDEIDDVVVSSVTPPLDPVLTRACQRYFGLTPRFTPRDLPIPLENRYARPFEVGADRLVTSFAARALYPDPVLVAVDFGTATTFDCVRDNAFLGGLICPGLSTSLSALAAHTSKLPHIALSVDGLALDIGTSTAECINQGFVHGFAAMVEGVAAKLRDHLGGRIRLVGTGGFAERLAPLCPSLSDVRPELLLHGLWRLSGRAEQR